jgi:hypothetical protein
MKTLTTSDRREFLRALRRAWSIETSPQWLPHDPARGQGPVTALVFHDCFGGEILKTRIGDDLALLQSSGRKGMRLRR